MLNLRSALFLLAAACACAPAAPPPVCPPSVTMPPAASVSAAPAVAAAVTRVPWTVGTPPLPEKKTVVVRPREIQDVLVNPGMGFQTFQRYQGQPLYSGMFGLTWSEAGPVKVEPDAPPSLLPRAPASSVAYCRWHWATLEPEKGRIRWEILDLALAEAKRHGQTLAFRIMPYDPDYPLPAWYRESGARRANRDTDKDGKVWHPDHADPLFEKHWGELVKKVGERYDGHPGLDSVDISSIGSWGEGSAEPMPPVSIEKRLVDIHFEAFHKTPLLVNDQPRVIEHAVGRGAGWRLDCWGDMRSAGGANWGHMLDSYPALTSRPGVRDAWQKAPVSLEVCGVVGDWYSAGWDIDYIVDQALRWHASTVSLKSTEVPDAWKGKLDDLGRGMGYRLILRRFEHPKRVLAGAPLHVQMWWRNAGVAPPYRRYSMVLRVGSGAGAALIDVPIDVTKMLPGDLVHEGDLALPALPPGSHAIAVALLDPVTRLPAVKLAIEGREADGFYPLGTLLVD
jgi:hypothetical protein